MSIGKNGKGYEVRILIKFNFVHLPEYTQIMNAVLSILVTKGTTLELQGYTLDSGWDIHSINWMNQPSINFSNKVFEKTISGCENSVRLTAAELLELHIISSIY